MQVRDIIKAKDGPVDGLEQTGSGPITSVCASESVSVLPHMGMGWAPMAMPHCDEGGGGEGPCAGTQQGTHCDEDEGAGRRAMRRYAARYTL